MRVEPDANGKLVFPSDSMVWDADCPDEWLVSRMKVIFVRQCYIDLYGLCQQAWGANEQGLFLKGTPGVGKSFFLDYVMCNLMNDGKKVLLLSGLRNRSWLCSGFDRPAEICNFDTALTDLWAKKADFVLFDPHDNPSNTQNLDPSIFCKKKFLIAMSPDPSNCARIVKDARSVESIYMGPTTMEESERMRICCYDGMVTSEQLQQRFDRGGGIPRSLFKIAGVLPRESNDDTALDDIDERQTFALNDLMINPMRIDAGSVASNFKGLWSLYHLVPDNLYTSYSIELCSANCHKLLLHQLFKKEVRDLWNLFDATNKQIGTLRGIRFEAYAHKKILFDGIKEIASLLTQNGISPITRKEVSIPAKSTLVDLSDNNLDSLSRYAAAGGSSSPTGIYLLPSLSNFPVIDSAYVGPPDLRSMFQMKSSNSKPFSEKAKTICRALGHFFVFVVPDATVIRKRLAGGPDEMQQYVLVLNETTFLQQNQLDSTQKKRKLNA